VGLAVWLSLGGARVERVLGQVAGNRAAMTARAASRALADTLLKLLAEHSIFYGNVSTQPRPGNHNPRVQAVARALTAGVGYGVIHTVWFGALFAGAYFAYLAAMIAFYSVQGMLAFLWWAAGWALQLPWWIFCVCFWEPSWWAAIICAASILVSGTSPPTPGDYRGTLGGTMWPLALWFWGGGLVNVAGTVFSVWIDVNVNHVGGFLYGLIGWTTIVWSLLTGGRWWARLLCFLVTFVPWLIFGAILREAVDAPEAPKCEEDIPTGAEGEVLRVLQCNDHYQVMELTAQEVDSGLKRAYHKKLLRVHPDKNGNAPGASRAFQRLSDAYEILSDPNKRSRYDREMRYAADAAASAAAAAPRPPSAPGPQSKAQAAAAGSRRKPGRKTKKGGGV